MTRRKRTTLIVSLTIAALLIAVGVAYAAGAFPDVDPSDVHAADIQWAADNGVVNGYTNGNFGPYDNITRGQAASMFKNYDDFAKESASAQGACKDCHNASTQLTSKAFQWSESVHGIGFTVADHWKDGVVQAGCAGCHSGSAFSTMVAAGQSPNEVTVDDTLPTPQDCRACHKVHETYTGADWALETTDPVEFYALPGKTFDGGAGNLCAQCHQPRVAFPAAVDGMVTFTSSRFGPHHGPQSATLAGTGGAGPDGAPFAHYTLIGDTCVTCHMGSNANHRFDPSIKTCQGCHPGAEDFNIGDTQTEVQAMLDELGAKLLDAGMITDTGAAVPGTYTEAKAAALWNYRDFLLEDKSLGAHNPPYVKALLQAGLDAFN